MVPSVQRTSLPGVPSSFIPLPSRVLLGLSEKISQYFISSRDRTVKEGENLLKGLASVRKALIEEGGKEIDLITEDGALVNGLHFHGNEQKALIYLHGNGCFYETAWDKPLALVEHLKNKSSDGADKTPHLVIFNPRGTGKSQGLLHPQNVAKDLFTVFKYLNSEYSIDPSQIIIVGHSMGAFWGALGAAEIQKEFPNKPIHFISDRSFGNLDTFVASKDLGISSYVMRPLAALTGWNKNPIEALKSLRGRVCVIYHELDGVIPLRCSTYSELQKHPILNAEIISLKDPSKQEITAYAHNRDFTEEEYTQVIAQINKMFDGE